MTTKVQDEAAAADLFADLTRNEQKLIAVLKQHDCRTLDQLAADADLAHTEVSTLLFDLNMRGIVKTLPGGAYRLMR